ncbi:MAG TPA: alpha/beta fold hydrolase [Usitatibacter sp.]|nr:alpha/beta fold hydrolase [Usitatibacter sp.]
MVANYLRFSLALEVLAYALISYWLHWLYGWSYAWLALGAAGAAASSRLLTVCITTAVGFAARSPRPKEHAIGLRATVAMLLREWRALLATNFVVFPWERFVLRPDPPLAPCEAVPVVMVHGYFSNRGYFRPLVRALEARGAEPLFTPNFRSAFASIDEFARGLHEEIERICAGTGQGQVVLLCHSMGGLAARRYLADHGPRRVRRLVTIASPHNGTVHARMGSGENARQMRRGSAFLRDLAEREGAQGPGCPVTSIYTPHDNLVAPQDTSRLPWARNIAIPGRGHVDILGCERLAAIVAKELQEAGVRLAA